MKQAIRLLSVVVVLALVAVLGFRLCRATAPELEADEPIEEVPEQVASELYFDTPVDWDFTTLVTSTGVKNEVALTFDDGPSEYTPQVLNILKQYDITASFCMLGVMVDEYPEMAQRIVDEGHQVCNHSYAHARTTNVGPKQGIVDEIEKTNETFKRVLDIDVVNWYRAPEGVFGGHVTDALAETDMMAMFWDVDSRDWQRPGTHRIVENVMNQVGPESIILFHDGGGDRSQTVAALPTIIERLLTLGYTFTVPLEHSWGYDSNWEVSPPASALPVAPLEATSSAETAATTTSSSTKPSGSS